MMAKKKSENKNNRWRSQMQDTHAGVGECWFCEYEVIPDYKKLDILQGFLSPRNKILSRQVTSTCAKHQRELSREVKIARKMALIS